MSIHAELLSPFQPFHSLAKLGHLLLHELQPTETDTCIWKPTVHPCLVPTNYNVTP